MNTFVVEPQADGQRIDRWLADRSEMSRSEIQKMMSAGKIRLNGAPVTKSHKVIAGEEIDILETMEVQEPARVVEIPIRFEDDHIVVVSKPAGLIVHPTRGADHRPTLVGALADLNIRSGPDPYRPGIVHRLDKETSGLMVVAKSEDAYDALVGMMKRREVARVYVALVAGSFEEKTGRIDAPIGRKQRDPRKRGVTASGKRAITSFRVKRAFAGLCLLEVSLETGRTHQIRVHMSHIGHPVLGDATYGPSTMERAASLDLRRPFLHASRLTFVHPFTGETLDIREALPKDLERVLKALEVE